MALLRLSSPMRRPDASYVRSWRASGSRTVPSFPPHSGSGFFHERNARLLSDMPQIRVVFVIRCAAWRLTALTFYWELCDNVKSQVLRRCKRQATLDSSPLKRKDSLRVAPYTQQTIGAHL